MARAALVVLAVSVESVAQAALVVLAVLVEPAGPVEQVEPEGLAVSVEQVALEGLEEPVATAAVAQASAIALPGAEWVAVAEANALAAATCRAAGVEPALRHSAAAVEAALGQAVPGVLQV